MGKIERKIERKVKGDGKAVIRKPPTRSSARTYPYYIRPSAVAGMGVFAQNDVGANVVVGFYEGKEYSEADWDADVDGIQDSLYLLTVENNKGTVQYYVDAREKRTSNFTRYINCARNRAELNCGIGHVLDKSQRRWRPVIRTTKRIPAGVELLLDYGTEYSTLLLGKPL